MATRIVHLLVAVVSITLLASSCSEEEATIIDLDAVSTTTTVDGDTSSTTAPPGDEIDPDDPNAEARQQVIDAARQQCLDDPELDEGVVRLVMAETGELANEYRVDCDEVRAEEG